MRNTMTTYATAAHTGRYAICTTRVVTIVIPWEILLYTTETYDPPKRSAAAGTDIDAIRSMTMRSATIFRTFSRCIGGVVSR